MHYFYFICLILSPISEITKVTFLKQNESQNVYIRNDINRSTGPKFKAKKVLCPYTLGLQLTKNLN